MSRELYHDHLVPADVREVLDRISMNLGTNVVIDGVDGEWVQFHVPGWSDRFAAIQLEARKEAILGAAAGNCHIYCAQNTPDGSGLWIQSLEDWYAERKAKSLPGVWFY